MNLSRIFKNNRLAKAMTGLTKQEFNDLMPVFAEAVYVEQKLKKPDRQRKMGAGQKGTFKTIEDKLICVLVYLKTYPTYDFLAVLVGGERTRACRNVQFLLKALSRALGRKIVMPERKIHSMEEFLEKFPEAKDIFLDGTERRKERPKNQKHQRKLYSGKKKGTMKKTLVISDEKRRILVMTPSKSGRRHDKRLADKEYLAHVIPPTVAIWTDTGFKGMEAKHPNVIMPKKATKYHPLTEVERADNRLISGIRVLSEHAIRGFKRFKAASDTLRNRIPNMDDLMNRVAAGLWNFHLQQTI